MKGLRIAFADESGTTGKSKCYAIGVVSVQEAFLDEFNSLFHKSKTSHGVDSEVKWNRVDRGHGLINFSLEWLHNICHSKTARFDVIVVHTRAYRKWSMQGSDRETAFYTTYTQLLRHLVREVKQTTRVFIDDRSDGYPKHTEVVEAIGNHMLAQLHQTGRLEQVTKVPSHKYPGIQVADVLTGAIAAAHRLHLDPGVPVNAGKRLTIERMAHYLGWNALHYDTWPSSRFNIWHFPREYRSCPATRLPQPAQEPFYIHPNDLSLPLPT